MAEPQQFPSTPPQGAKTGDSPKAQATIPDAGKDPIREMLERMQRSQQEVAKVDRGLGTLVEDLQRQSNDPLRLNQRSFQREIGYAFQDLERKLGPLQISPEARSEATRLATSAPGLDNDRMLSLMRSTANLSDTAIVNDIRRAGTEIGRQADQNTPAILSRIDVLENRVRLARRPVEPAPEPNSRPITNAEASATGRPAPSGQPQGTIEPPDGNAPSGTARRPDATVTQRSPATGGQPFQPGALDALLRSLRSGAGTASAPWEPMPTPFAGRLTAFQGLMRAGRDDILLQGAERAGRAAADALEGFRTGEGATVMSRIQTASRSEPGGMAAVLAEMREGGRFHDLRQQFNNALTDEKGLVRAYDRAANALAEYGRGRTGVEQVIARRPDAANLAAKFEQLDAQIGEAAGSTPSRREGKSMIDDIAKHAAEIVQRAVESARSVFSRNNADISRPAASPSMGG